VIAREGEIERDKFHKKMRQDKCKNYKKKDKGYGKVKDNDKTNARQG
jgi:hypothetical protein